MASTVVNSAPSPPAAEPRRWYQFTLRTAGVWMVLLCLLLGSFAWWRDRAERQRKVVEELRGLGATVDYEYFSNFSWRHSGSDVGPDDEFVVASFLRRVMGDDFVSHVSNVNYSPSIYDEPHQVSPVNSRRAVELVKHFPRLHWLVLRGDVTSQDLRDFPFLESLEVLFLKPDSGLSRGLLTDDDLVAFDGSTRLEVLSLADQPLEGQGLAHLRNCKKLRHLQLCRTNVGDAGLAHLSAMANLEILDLLETKISDAGVAKTSFPQRLQVITLSRTDAGDSALDHLQQLPNLIGLSIEKTQMTAEAIQRFQEKRPKCKVFE